MDVFFVISGYLITSIILKEVDKGTFSLRRFWERRIRRIVPALAWLVLVTLTVAWAWSFEGRLHETAKHALYVIIAAGNVRPYMVAGDYWGGAAEDMPFLHTWSLAVEEQFYFLYPLILSLILKYWKACLPWVLRIGLAAGLLLSIGLTHVDQPAAFYLLPARIWELLSGGALACALYSGKRFAFSPRTEKCLAWLGLAIITVASLWTPGGTHFPGALTILPVLGTVLVISYASPTNCWILNWKPVIYIGKLSYSLYLWHWVVIVALDSPEFRLRFESSLTLSIALMVALSVFSYHLIEAWGRRLTWPWIFMGATSVSLVALAYPLTRYTNAEINAAFEKPTWVGDSYDVASTASASETHPGPDAGLHREANAFVERSTGNPAWKAFVWGDSHGLMWAPVIDETSVELGGAVRFHASAGTPPIIGGECTGALKDKQRFDGRRMADLSSIRPEVVFLASNRNCIEQYPEAFAQLLEEIHARSPNTKVLMLEPTPIMYFGNGDGHAIACYLKHQGKDTTAVHALDANKDAEAAAKVRDLAAKYPFLKIIPCQAVFSCEAGIHFTRDKTLLYIDDDHLSLEGTRLLKPAIKQAILDAIAEKNP